MQADNTDNPRHLEERVESTPVNGDRDPMPFEDESSGCGDTARDLHGQLEGLSLARLKAVYAFRHGAFLLIYVEGFTYGYGGRLIVEQRPERILPPLFHIHELPGLGGINPAEAPHDMPTFEVSYFDVASIGDSILVQGRDGQEKVIVLSASPGITP